MKIIYLVLFILTASVILSQDLYIPNNPYDKADENTKNSNAFKSERWFYEQRMYPNNYIPENAYKKSMDERDALRSSQGFFYPNSLPWTNVGPTPGYYFAYGNISGRIPTIKYDPNNPNIIYFGAAFGGVWKSTNGGLNWVNLSDFEVSLSSGALAIDKTNSNIIYYGTGEATYSGASYYGRGLLKSTNGGLNWVNYTSGLPTSTYCSRIVIRPNHNTEIFAAFGTSGLYKSSNSGVNWTQIVSGRCDDIIFKTSGDTAYITGSGTGYRISIDGGVTFTANTALTMSTRNHIAFCKASPNVLYVAIHGSSTANVFKSTNSGLNYTQVVTNLSGGGQAWYDFYMHCNPANPNIAYVGAIDVWRTTNGGTNFINITNSYGSGVVHPDQHNIDFNPTNPDEIMCANDGGVWKSINQGTTWTNLNNGLSITQFYWMASDPTNAAHLMGGTQDNGSQRTTGTLNWTASFGGDGGVACFHIKNSNYMLGESQNNGLMRSADNGVTWNNATSGLTGSGAWVAPIICHPDSVEIFYTARQQVFKTTNMGAIWTPISTGTSGSTISQMNISKSNANIMFASIGSVLYKSTNRGYTFATTSSGMPSRTISSINVHPDSSNVVVVTFSGFGAGKIYKTTNGGTTWTNISGNLPDSPTNDGMIYYPGYSTSYYLVAMDIGVFMTSNWGNNWIELANGLPNTVAMHLDHNRLANKIRIGTHGRSTWQITGSLINIVNYNSELPKNYELSQNYPNPFNPSTRIKFALTKTDFTRLEVYNMLGRKVSTLIEKNLDAGTYEINFDANEFPSGIYFYKLTTSEFSDAKKMMLAK